MQYDLDTYSAAHISIATVVRLNELLTIWHVESLQVTHAYVSMPYAIGAGKYERACSNNEN